MNKLITKIVGAALGLTMAVGVGTAIGANRSEAVPVHATPGDPHTLFDVTTASNWGTGHSAYTDTWTSNSCVFTGGANNNGGWAYVRLGGKSLTNADRSIGTTVATTYVTSSVTITVAQLKSNSNLTINSVTFKVWESFDSSTNVFSSEADSIDLSSDYAAGAVTVEPSSGDYWDSGVYFQLIVNVSNSKTSNYGTDISKIVATEGAEAGSDTIEVTGVSVSGITDNSTISDGSYGDTRNLTATVSYTQGEGYADGNNSVTWSSDDEDIATVDSDGVVTFVGNGQVTITATSNEDNNYSDTVTFTLENIVAPKVVTYTIDSKTSVATTGLTPIGSSATYAQTYSTQGQATSGNTITLTISGFSKGTIINSIVMNMRSNGSSGAGGLTYSADSGANQTLIAAATNFNAWGDNSSYGTTYRDVTIGSNLSISVTTSFVLTLTASTNSLYVNSYTISYDYAAPTFTVAPTNHEIYTGENAASTVSVANFDTDPTLEYAVTSGASSISTVSISSYSSHVATVTITASSTAGTAVVRVRDSANPSTYYGDITVVVNEIPAYEIELSADSYAYVGDDVDVVVTTSRLQGTGINWSVISGSVDSESVISDDTEYMATITSAGTLTIKATDNGNAENYATVSVTVVKTLNAVNAPNVTNHSSELTFTGKYSEDGEEVDGVASDIWTVTSDGTESTWDSSNGIHYGTNSASVQYVQLSTSSIATGANDTIKSIVVNTQDRATTKGSLTVTVGGVNFKHEGSTSVTVTGAAADYTFTGNGTGEIVVKVDRGSAATKAIYVKSVTVNYVTENGSSNIANAANMYLAQKAVIDYANDFNTALEAVCVAYGSTDTTDLENAWNDLADQYGNWFNNGDVDLTAEEIAHAKALFANADSVDRNKTPSADDLQHMLAKYDWILSHYQFNDFLANDSGTNRPIVQNSSPRIGLFGNIDSSNATAIIVVVSLVSLTAIGGYFFIRKRKEQ